MSGGSLRLRRAVPLPAPSLNWGSAPDPAPQSPEGLEGGAPLQPRGPGAKPLPRGGAAGHPVGPGRRSVVGQAAAGCSVTSIRASASS
ncbi:hypothetical protein FGK60_32120 [Streptomyces sp. DASNCL29]|nr:hypothetical protein FGK60_32120 [Streptomyces sp. DASNCL29]